MKHQVLSLILVLALCAGCRTGGRATKPTADGQGSPEFIVEEPAAKARLASIRKELAAAQDHPWAGVYHRGDPYGPVGDDLILAPGSGYVLQLRGRKGTCSSGCPNCASGHASVAAGTIVTSTQDTLKLAMELSPGNIVLVEELVPLHWGARRYLVTVEQYDGFLAAVDAGTEPRTTLAGPYYLRESDPLDPNPAGRPQRWTP